MTSTFSIAGDGGGKILGIVADEGVAHIRTAVHNNPPPCAPLQGGIAEWSLSTVTGEGKAKYALILMAFAQNRPISIKGKNDCSVWGDREAIGFVHIAP